MNFDVVNQTLDTLETWEGVIVELLQRIGETSGAKRASLFKTQQSTVSRGVLASLAYEWATDDSLRRFNDDKFQSISLDDVGLGSVLEQLGSRLVVVVDTPATAIEPFLSLTLGTTITFPILGEEMLWGYIVVEGVDLDATARADLQASIKRLEERILQQQAEEAATKLKDYSAKIEAVMSDDSLSVDGKIEHLLGIGCEAFDLGVAIVSNIVGQTYTVKHYYPEDSGLSRGQVFELGQTYCSITLRLGAVVGIPYVQESPYQNHPCYQVFQLVAYFGVQLRVDGKYYGTVNFSSPTPHTKPFTDVDREIIRLISEKIGELIPIA